MSLFTGAWVTIEVNSNAMGVSQLSKRVFIIGCKRIYENGKGQRSETYIPLLWKHKWMACRPSLWLWPKHELPNGLPACLPCKEPQPGSMAVSLTDAARLGGGMTSRPKCVEYNKPI